MSFVRLFVLAAHMIPVSRASGAYNFRHRRETIETEIHTLWEEQASEEHKHMLGTWESSLRPLFLSMPKNEAGRLDARGVRFVLHRVFVKRFGWHIQGLASDYDDGEDYRHTFADAGDDWVRSISQTKFQVEGAGIRGLALLAFALEELLRRSSADRLRKVYEAFNLSVDDPFPTKLARIALFHFFCARIIGAEPDTENLAEDEEKLQRAAPMYGETELEKIDARTVRYFESVVGSVTGSKAKHMMTFSDTLDLAQKLLKHFAHYNDKVCDDLKHGMFPHDVDNVGRLSLANFYSIMDAPQFRFTERLEYLKAAGAIDDSQPQNPKVILINYILSSGNCLRTGDRITFCCRSACHDIMYELESSVLEPSAPPRRIVEILSRLPTPQMKAPAANISSDLLRKLDQIAATNLGRVPLHGRLFAQWLHHVFPHECAYPTHLFAVGGDREPTRDEWTLQTGQDPEEEENTRKDIIASSPCPIPGDTIQPILAAPSWCNDQSIIWDLTEHLPFQQFKPRLRVRGIASISFGVASVVATLCTLLQQLWKLGRFGTVRRWSKSYRYA